MEVILYADLDVRESSIDFAESISLSQIIACKGRQEPEQTSHLTINLPECGS